MAEYILRLATAVPPHAYSQDYACERMKGWARNPRDRRVLQYLFRQSGIERRHSVCADFAEGGAASLFPTAPDGALADPGTGERNDRYVRESRVLGVEAARRALDTAPFLRRDEVTHIVTVSCTGFSNPGLDCHLINDLGLSASVRRYNLGFMGCQASMPALAMAQQFCQADSSAVVLVVSTEICSLHLRADATPDAMLANTLFADGAACAIVHGRENLASSSVFRLDQFATSLAAEGGGEMAWTIGNHGFNLVLSSYIPDLIEANIASLVDPVLGGLGLTRSDVGHWAVHPGGKAVLDKVAAGLDLPADALAISRDILRRYGNMSSATILFVLDELSRQPRDRDETVCAMAFGPGLTIELSVLHARAGVRDEAPAAPTERRA